MPYYPGNSGSFFRHGELKVTVPILYRWDKPNRKYYIGDQAFYFYLLANLTPNMSVDSYGDIHVKNPVGYGSYFLDSISNYYQVPSYPL